MHKRYDDYILKIKQSTMKKSRKKNEKNIANILFWKTYIIDSKISKSFNFFTKCNTIIIKHYVAHPKKVSGFFVYLYTINPIDFIRIQWSVAHSYRIRFPNIGRYSATFLIPILYFSSIRYFVIYEHAIFHSKSVNMNQSPFYTTQRKVMIYCI